MSVNLGGELTRFLVMANGAHGPVDAPVVSGAPRVAEPGEPAVAVSAAAPRVATVEFAPVDGAAQLVRLPGPAELDEPAAAEVDEPAQLPEVARVDEAETFALAADSHAPGDLHARADSAVAAPPVVAWQYRDLAQRGASLDPA